MTPETIDLLSYCSRDPIAFVRAAFDWDSGFLAGSEIDPWQLNLLDAIRVGLLTPNEAIQIATASGHGIGKSTVVSWIILWAFMTSPDCRGVITANTEPQLKTKTWAELGKWFNLCIFKDSFQLTATALLSRDRDRERTWRIDMMPWNEKNPQAFAGLHNKGRRILLIFDEASEIPDIIWETAEGALTDADTEILWLVFGNPTSNTGRFKACFDTTGHGRIWTSRQIDSRSVAVSNKTQINKWIESYGEDSDFVRIRVKGQFPRVGEMEFISASAIDAAMAREPESQLSDPLALGVDVARYGAAASVLFFRKGRDARTIARKIFRGVNTVELANHVQDAQREYHCDGIFIDGGGVGGGVVDNCRARALSCMEIQFGGKDDVGGRPTGNTGEKYANKRAAMWGAMRSWINTGALPYDEDLKAQLLGPKYTLNVRGEIQLESKEEMSRRGVASPDDADALALTFAYPLEPHAYAGGIHSRPAPVTSEYDPFSAERMAS